MNYKSNRIKRDDKKHAHHLWSANECEDGKINIVRSKTEPEDFEEKLMNRDAKEVFNACWGLWGASLTDDELLSNSIPSGVVSRLNKAANNLIYENKKLKRILSWDELRTAFGSDKVNEIRKNISNGMGIRVVSKHLNVPFMVTAELLDHLGDVDGGELKDIVNIIKSGNNNKKASEKFGNKIKIAERIYNHYSKTGMHKLSVDEKAKQYFEDYFGPFGKELTREIKKRVRADLIKAWMNKNGVDEKAVEYWSNYFADYGREWVSILPKKISPK